MNTVERLRALEKKYETRLANWTREHDHCATEWNYAHRRQCSDIVDDLRALIAELGQEAGAVGTVVVASDSLGCLRHMVRWHGGDGGPPTYLEHGTKLYPSPAHTSEARDAVLKGVRELALKAAAHWDADEDVKVGLILMALAGQLPKYDKRADAFDAAMQKESAP